MKQKHVLFFAAIATGTFCMEKTCIDQNEVDTRCTNCKPPRDQHSSNSQEMGKVVIANFLNMFAQFLQMATNPHDKDTLIAGGMGIAQSLANIAQEACKCVELNEVSAEELLSYVSSECAKASIDVELTKQLTRAIKLQYWKSALLPQETRVRYAEYAEHFDTSND